MLTSYLLVGFCLVGLAAGQLLFKAVGSRTETAWDVLKDRKAAGLLGLALVIYAACTLAWISALRTLPLSRAYVFVGLGFVLVPLSAHYVLGEPLSGRFLLGSAVVCLGIWIAVS